MKKLLISLLAVFMALAPSAALAIAVSWDRPQTGRINPLFILDTVYGNIFTATSTTAASTFPYASTTAFTISGTGYFPGSGIWTTTNVGIGTTSPTKTLEINTAGTGSTVQVDGNSTTVASSIGLTDFTTSGNTYTMLVNPSGTSNANVNTVPLTGTISVGAGTTNGIILTTRAVNAPIRFYTGGNSLTTNLRMVVNDTGVGVSTSTPGSLFAIGTTGTNAVANFTSATSTFYSTGGINLTGGGCFAINGICVTGSGGSSASSTLLSDNNTWSGLNAFAKSTTTLSTLNTTWFSGLANSLLAVDQNGKVIASSTIGTNLLTGTLATINTTAITAGGTFTITAASSTLLSNNNTWTGLNTFSNASTTLATHSGAMWLTNLTASTLLALDQNKMVISTSSIGTNLLTGTVGTINTTALPAGGSITITAASSTALVDANTWTKLQNFANASSTLTTLGTTWLGLTNALLSTDASGKIVATSSVGTNYLTGTLATINTTAITAGGSFTITAASSTLLSNSNTWTGLQNFANATSTLFSATTAWIGTLNLTNPLGITSGGTGLSTTGASSTILTTNGTANAWQKLDLAAAVYGVLPIANGGTASSTALGGILAGNGSSAVKSVVIGSNLTWDGTTLAATASGGGGGDSFYHPAANQSATTSTMLLYGNASTTLLTATSSVWLTSITNALLSTDQNGKIVATSTIGNSLLTNGGALTVNTSAPLGGGGSVALGGTLTLTCTNCNTYGWPWSIATFNGTTSNATTTQTHYISGFSASSTSAIQYASTTALSVSDSSYLGTVKSGTWNGTAIASGFGGTGIDSSALSGIAVINSGVWSASSTLAVNRGGSGAATLTGLLQGNGTSAFTAITDSSTVGQVLRVTGTNTYAWGALNLASGNAVTGVLPIANGGTNASSLSSHMLTAFDGTRLVPTSTPTVAAIIATSSTANSTFAGEVGIASSSPMSNSVLNVVGTTTFIGQVNHYGTTFCGTGGLYPYGLQGDEWCGNDNTDGGGVQRIVANMNSGNKAWSGLTFNNNLADNTLTHFAGIYYNSSTYSSSFFGTGYAIPNLLLMQNTDGPVGFFTGTSTNNGASNLYISFNTGSTNTTDERMRITAPGNIVMGTTTTRIGVLTVGSSTAPQIMLSDDSSANNLWAIRTKGSMLYIATSTATATSTLPAMSIDGNGTAGLLVGTTSNSAATLAVNGRVFFASLTASGSTQAGDLCLSSGNEVINDSIACIVSARRFKQDINTIDPAQALQEVMALKPASFYYKPAFNGALQTNPNYNGEQVGFIAEDVHAVDPRLTTVVTSGPETGQMESVRYQNMTALLVAAIQAQEERIKPLARSAEEDWQWIAIALLFGALAIQQAQIFQLKKRYAE